MCNSAFSCIKDAITWAYSIDMLHLQLVETVHLTVNRLSMPTEMENLILVAYLQWHTFVTKPIPSWPATKGVALCASPYMPPVRAVYKSAGLIGASCMLTRTSPHSRLAASGSDTSSRDFCGGPALLHLTCMHMCDYQIKMQIRLSQIPRWTHATTVLTPKGQTSKETAFASQSIVSSKHLTVRQHHELLPAEHC